MKRTLAFLLALTMLFALGACGKSANSSPAEDSAQAAEETGTETAVPEVAITDMIGREVSVSPGSYTRVACIGAGALRLYSYICGADLLCGVEDIDNPSLENRPKMFDSVARPYVMAYGEAFSALPSCGVGGPQAQAAEAEKILSCNPDIVISEYTDVEKENALQEQLGVPVITLSYGSQGVFDDSMKASLRLLGKIFAREDRAEELVNFIEAEAAELSARTADVPDSEKPSVYICGLGNWGTTNHLFTAENYAPFRTANIQNAVSGLDVKGVAELEAEKFTAIGPETDIVIIDAAAIKNILPLYAEDNGLFDGSSAFESDNVYLQMAYNAYYTNCEIELINTWFCAQTVYPYLFEDIVLTEKADEITEMFLGMPLGEAICAMPGSYGGWGRILVPDFFDANI